jgi:integrase
LRLVTRTRAQGLVVDVSRLLSYDALDFFPGRDGREPISCAPSALSSIRWLDAARIVEGPVFRAVSTGNRPGVRPMNPGSVNALVQAAVARAGLDSALYSAHSLRAGFVTYAHLRGASDRAIAHQTRHRSLATLGQYVRVAKAWDDNAATQLGF